ncbi:MAG: aldo/keto reductase [Chitinivibrionales bacterium]|nr:aldo/keto reductase [Chitinivibrionales bacterium]
MEYRQMGKTGLRLSAFSFGSWVTFGKQLDEQAATECMTIAYEAGVNFFDNAEAYGQGQSELIMGSILKKLNWSRDTFVVSSKVFWGGEKPNQKGLSRKHVVEACNAALKRLQLDYLDLYYCHRPDESTPIEETVWAMHQLFMQGKLLYWGTSEWSSQQIMQAFAIAQENHLIAPSMEQPQYNMFHRERVENEFRRLYQEIGLGLTTWSPLASGLLTGKYNSGIAPQGSRATLSNMQFLTDRLIGPKVAEKIGKIEQLTALAQDCGISMTQLALLWCLKNPAVSSVILGASNVEQLRHNLDAANKVSCLTEETMKRIEEILQNKPQITLFT